jgi:hypothetical protein
MRWALGIVLAGCTPAVVVPLDPPIIGTGSAIVLEVQSIVRERCRFLPTADTVGAILATAPNSSDAIASQICLAVLQSRTDQSAVRVNGVLVYGRFTR